MAQDKLRMQMLAGIITEGQYKVKINEGSDAIIPKSLVTRYANMKSLFGDKAKDPSVISKLIPIITDFFPKNLDVSYQKLVDKFGEETANQVQTVLLGAYLDGYLDRFQEPITRLNSERDAKYPDYMGERNKVEELNEGLTSSLLDQYKDKTGPQGLIISKLLTLEKVLTQHKKEQSSNPDPNVTVESIIDMVLETFNEIRDI